VLTRHRLALLAVALAAMMASPAMAQVPGIAGSAACAGVGQKTASLILARTHTVGQTSAEFTLPNIGGGYFLPEAGSYPYTLYQGISKADGTGGFSHRLIVEFVSSTNPSTYTGALRPGFALEANTNYVLFLHTNKAAFQSASSPNAAKVGLRVCFKTGPSASQMSRPLRWHNDVQRFAGGCFAFGGTPAQVSACGKGRINAYLHRYAVKNMSLNLSRTFVPPYALEKNSAKSNVAAYYTLAHLTLAREEPPNPSGLPRYPAPVILLAQLGIDQQFHRQGLGTKTLMHALRHAHQIACNPKGIPALGAVLDVLDQDALSFYSCFDFFLPLTSNPMKLVVPMTSLETL